MENLAFLTSPDMSKAEVVTNHVVIAQYAGLNRISVRKLIDKNIQDLKKLGKVSFEMTALDDSRGQKVKIYQLNRNQAMLLITWLDNTETVRAFKLALVKRFDEMEKELQYRKIERATEKVTTRNLTDAVQSWENKSQHSYSHIRNLLVKLATGCPHTHIKKRDPSNKTSMVDLLTTDELEEYNYFKSLVIPMLSKHGTKSMTYHDIKEKLEFLTTKKLSETLASDDSF
ncbi:Rha family transcriptional regulator [Lactococcus petauri]|uniref:Rha family transcriptional regulator n=1 Tax=Lactococcus petauri TaxID=1940789 RepID=UPI0038521C73